MRHCWVFLFITFCSFAAEAQWKGRRDPAAFARVPEQLNEKALVDCLPRLKGYLSKQETNSLDNLKTKIERIYGMQRPLIEFRELIYKNQAEQRFKVEFYLIPGSLWGKESYRLKQFRASESGAFVEQVTTGKDETSNREALLRFAQFEQIENDERWERFAIPGNPKVLYKSKNFKIFEITAEILAPKKRLTCNITGGYPFCSCSQ